MKEKPYKFVLRLPTEMRGRIVEAAVRYRRSINSEIVARLERSFSDVSLAGAPAPLNPHLEYVLRSRLDEEEQRLVLGFRNLERKKREALLNLLS